MDRLMRTVMGRLISVRTMVKIPILVVSQVMNWDEVAYLIPPASGTEYVPLGPGLLEPPTKTIEQKLIKATNMSMGNVPDGQLDDWSTAKKACPCRARTTLRFVSSS